MFNLVKLLQAVVFLTVMSQNSAKSSIISNPKEPLIELDRPCINPNGESGRCVYLWECQSLLTISKNTILFEPEFRFLYRSQCRGTFNGKSLVCCASSNFLPNPEECGRNVQLIHRIHGGEEAELGEFPWIALLWFRHPEEGVMFNCGGTLINNRYVLTAAHCLESHSTWTFSSVTLGSHNISDYDPDCDGSGCEVEVGFEKVIIHEDYRPQQKGKFNDIALIRLNRTVRFSDNISPICLPIETGVRFNEGLEVIAAGWGLTEKNVFSEVPLKVSLTITSQRKCIQLYRSKFQVRSTQFCAEGGPGKDTCSGDSGGPLMRQVNDTFYLYGIVSFGPKKCATEGVAGIYTNVVQYIDWIRSKLE